GRGGCDEPRRLPARERTRARADRAGERHARGARRGVCRRGDRPDLRRRVSRAHRGERRVRARAGDRGDPRRESRAGRDLPRRQGGRARLLRRPGDAGDAGQGRSEGRQPAAAGEASGVGGSSSSERLGAFRIGAVAVPTTGGTSRSRVSTPTVSRGETVDRSSPASSGPSGAPQSAIVRATLFTRPVSSSGTTPTRYPITVEFTAGSSTIIGTAPASRT